MEDCIFMHSHTPGTGLGFTCVNSGQTQFNLQQNPYCNVLLKMWASVYYSMTFTCANLDVFYRYLCVCVYHCAFVKISGNLWESLSPLHHVGPSEQTLVFRVGGKCLSPCAASLAYKLTFQLKLVMSFSRGVSAHSYCLAARRPLTWLTCLWACALVCECSKSFNTRSELSSIRFRALVLLDQSKVSSLVLSSPRMLLPTYAPLPRENEDPF